ncbi:MAG: hypothetical protein ACRD3E_11060 [Terriglobales bacterium]
MSTSINGSDADGAPDCPECGHPVREHGHYSCCHVNQKTHLCDCPCLLSREQIAVIVNGEHHHHG